MKRPALNRLQHSLSELLTADPLDEKWLLAPSLRIGFQWLDAIVLSGRTAVNVRVKTLSGMAAELAGVEMARLGVSKIPDLRAELTVSRLLAEGGSQGYFGSLGSGFGMARAMLRAVRDLRQAGLTSQEIEERSFEVDSKGREIRRIAAGYEQALKSGRFVDGADIARMAEQRLRSDPDAVPNGAFAIVPKETAYRLKGLDRRLIDAFPEKKLKFISSDEPDASKAGPVPTSIFRAIGEVNEVREALRDCASRGIRLDQVEIVHTDAKTYLPLIYEIASSLWDGDIPVTFSEGVPVGCSRPGRAFMAWLSLSGDAFPADTAARMVGERLVEIDASADPIASLLETAPSPKDESSDLIEKASRFVDLKLRCVDELDGYAKQMLKQEIGALASCLGPNERHRLDAMEWLKELPQRLRVGGKGPRPGCVHVAPLSHGGHCGRRYVFAIGLDDARFPGGGAQNPLLLDHERRRISTEMQTSDLKISEERSSLDLMLSRARGEVALGFCCRGLEEDQKIFASSAVVEQYRKLFGDAESDQEEIAKRLPSVSFAPDSSGRCVSQAEWWLMQACRKGETAGLRNVAHETFLHLKRGEAAREARLGDRFTEYDGYVPLAGEDLNPLKSSGPVMSASRFEKMGSCPSDFFFKYALEIEPPLELRRDRTGWLDPLGRGNLLHEVFRRFIGHLIERGLLPEFHRDKGLLAAMVEEAILAEVSTNPPPNRGAFETEKKEILEIAFIFLKEQELICRESRPVYLEASLGIGRPGDGTPIDTDKPIEIELANGKRFFARARIDRVDELPSKGKPRFALWDYKTGSAYKFKKKGTPFFQGRAVQNALYTLIAGLRLSKVRGGASIDSFGYFFAGLGERGKRIVWSADELAPGKEVLLRLCEAISSGCFLASNDSDDLKYSDYLEIYGDQEAAARDADRKLNNIENGMLAPLRALREKKEKGEAGDD